MAGSILRVLPAAFLSPTGLLAGAGGLAAAIAIGAFFGQAIAVLTASSDEDRRRRTAEGGFGGLFVLIGLILISIGAR